MRKLTIILLFFIGFSFNFPIEHLNFNKGISFIQQHNFTIEQVCNEFKLESKTVLPIVFPELCRNNLTQEAEFSILCYDYLYGNNSFDFSVGDFQMKLSFIEKLENQLYQDSKLKEFKKYFKYSSTIDLIIKKERLERMQSVKWQTAYLCLFYYKAKNEFLAQNDTKNELKYYATVYNIGLGKSPETIKLHSNLNLFPNGKAFENSNVNYSEYAQYFKKIYYHEDN